MKVKQTLEHKLSQAFAPKYLQLINESHSHRVAPGAETHFKVIIVSDHFSGENRVHRHRTIHKVLQQELDDSLKALSIQAFSPEEWSQNATIISSPPCVKNIKRKPS